MSIQNLACAPPRSLLAAALALAFGLAVTPVHARVPQTPITVQVINDSGLPDSQVMLLVAGKDVQTKDPSTGVTTTYPFSVNGVSSVDLTNAPTSAVSAGALSNLELASFTVNSPYSGARKLPVYTFTMSTVGSGALYVSYAPSGTPALSMPPAPTVTANYRFQPIEFSYSNAIVSNGDLTTIDFYGIPLQMQTYAPGDTTFSRAIDKVTYYTSTPTLLQSFLSASPNLQYAFRATGGSVYSFNAGKSSYSASDFANFARIVGPNQAAAAWSDSSPVFYPPSAPSGWTGTWPPTGTMGSPYPYPSFSSYLAELAKAEYTFTEVDDRVISAYTFHYTGKVLPMTAGTTDTCLPNSLAAPGYYIKLTGTTSGAAPLPDNADICIPLPTNGAAATYSADGKTQLTPPISSGDFVVYGATQNCEALALYSADGNNGNTIGIQPCTDSNAAQLGAIANSIYGWIQADVLSALNFGYMQGNADKAYGGGRSNVWYGHPPAQYPFGAARNSPDDGFYNPWAALVYNNSDAYGFAFSDRKGRPSPDISFPIGGTLRLWILPDVRLDAPLVTVTATDDKSVTLSWPRVANAGQYLITYGPDTAPKTKTVAQTPAGTSPTATIDGLAGNSPYRFTVRTIGRTGLRQSTEMTVQATTTEGTQPKAAQGNLEYNFSLNWTPPTYLGATPDLWIGGIQATYGMTAGAGKYAVTGLPITVGPLTSAAPLTINPVPGTATAPYLTATLDDPTVAAGAVSNLAVTLNNPTAAALTMNMGYSITLPSSVTGTIPTSLPANACPGIPAGAVVNAGGVVPIGATPLAAHSSCVIPVALTSSTVGTVLIVAPALTENVDAVVTTIAAAVDVPLTITGDAPGVTQTIAPAAITAGGTATLTLSFANKTRAPLTLLEPWFNELPPAVIGSAPQGGSGGCSGAAIDSTGAILSLPRGAISPVGGCSIVSTLTANANAAGSFTNTAGPLITNATNLPTEVYPVVMRMPATAAIQAGSALWSGNLYLTFLGTPWSYSVGPCQPTDSCVGATPSPTNPVAYSTQLVPNFLENQDASAGLSLAGGVQALGPPFAAATPAAIGVSFTPNADKRFSAVVVPTP